jgi:hypothetical protein
MGSFASHKMRCTRVARDFPFHPSSACPLPKPRAFKNFLDLRGVLSPNPRKIMPLPFFILLLLDIQDMLGNLQGPMTTSTHSLHSLLHFSKATGHHGSALSHFTFVILGVLHEQCLKSFIPIRLRNISVS